ncbi:MAG: peptidyl-prolyl cis-trans isomerase [Myxococcota bacterium]|nr:peptidyl-prolyl cis-trans isomerase [Myxococcota bacterium]
MKRALLALALLAPVALTAAQPAQAEIVDRVAAVVNKEVITLSEIYDYAGDFIEQQVLGAPANDPRRRAMELDVLDFLIQRQLINQEIQRLGMDVTREELDRAMEDTARQNGLTRDQLRVEVERSGMSWATYRSETEDALRQMKFNQIVLLPRVAVTDDEILDFYQRRLKNSGATTGALELSVIFLPPAGDEAAQEALLERAQGISDAAQAGADWTQLVSENPDSLYASQGGDMGALAKDEAVPELQVLFTLPIGAVSAPIVLSNGAVAVVKVMGEEAGQAPPLELVREDLYNELAQRKLQEEMELWYAQARRTASVRILLESADGF